MVQDLSKRGGADLALQNGPGLRVLILEAPYYEAVNAELFAGAKAVFDGAKIDYDRVSVPGALELPQAFASAIGKDLFSDQTAGAKYAGAIALGCVIRGETAHYDIVCNNTNHWLMTLAVTNRIPLGNAVLTVDTLDQALARARGGAMGKGGDAARACLRLMRLARDFGTVRS
jgi:6,7-dimethyl-8-ribityllumazine synthase